MQFIMRPLPRFQFTAQLQQDGQPVTLTLTGQAMTPRQHKAHVQACKLDGGDFDSVAFLLGLIPECNDLVDTEGNPVPWDADAIDALLWDDETRFQTLLDAYRQSAAEAARKN